MEKVTSKIIIFDLRYNVATEDWTELDAKLPHVMFSHAAMFMKDPACPGASVQNNGGDIKCLRHDYQKSVW